MKDEIVEDGNKGMTTAPEVRKLQPGDRVKLKGGQGPEMVVNQRGMGKLVSCAFWNDGHLCFAETEFHEDALAYFGDGLPPSAAGNVAPLTTVPKTVSPAVLKVAIRNGRSLMGAKYPDRDTLSACFEVLVAEVAAHVSIDG